MQVSDNCARPLDFEAAEPWPPFPTCRVLGGGEASLPATPSLTPTLCCPPGLRSAKCRTCGGRREVDSNPDSGQTADDDDSIQTSRITSRPPNNSKVHPVPISPGTTSPRTTQLRPTASPFIPFSQPAFRGDDAASDTWTLLDEHDELFLEKLRYPRSPRPEVQKLAVPPSLASMRAENIICRIPGVASLARTLQEGIKAM
ncbi:hypothetical protein EXIGLDRAFT_458962 [Exidia glandulosa HHB12029]|uniref:Uncharacterized protein n=1 Tax=Exidia glandulosa HHB12029 TaxID=1314781 RepID=A0A166BMN6_EXIGL|nr:hypothetical protein EXIGLDRAFT_458962 [Exidia glandulosa HHB12029]